MPTAPEPYRSRTTLVCQAAGCRSTYTYLGGEPRVRHSVADLERDRVLALQRAAEWGWHVDLEAFDRSERCPQHPREDDVDDEPDHGQGY
jgi:hypothetical protein